MKLYDWNQVPEEQVNPLAWRQMISSDTMIVIRRRLSKGAVTQLHQHVDEQISMIERGRIRFIVADEERIVAAGEALAIPSNEMHSVEALEDSIVMDLFAKPRT